MKMKSIVQLNRKISVSKELIEASKGLLTLGVVTSNVQVAKFNEELWDLLQKVGESQKKYDPNKIDEIPQIRALIDTYKTLGLKTSEYKGSNEALLKRILTDKGLYKINTVVDVNNYISVDSLRSVGSYDLSQLSGDIEFRKGQVGEKYLGTTNRSVVLKNLPVLCDEKGPFGSPTSDSSRALIKDTTTDIMTVIFSFDGSEGLEEQMLKIGNLLKKYADSTSVNIYSIKDKPIELILTNEDMYDTLVEKITEVKIQEVKKNFEEYKETTVKKEPLVKTSYSKEHKEDLSNYELIDGEVKKLAIGFNNILTGEMHGDMKQLRAVEYVVNLLKFRGLIKNEPTKVEGDESLGFAYNGVKLDYKSEECGEITVEKKDLPSLNLKLCDNHFELFFSNPENNSNINELVEVIGTTFDF